MHVNPYGTLEHALTSFMASVLESRENSHIFVAKEKESRRKGIDEVIVERGNQARVMMEGNR